MITLGKNIFSKSVLLNRDTHFSERQNNIIPISPAILKKGDTVAITAPASPSSPGQVASWVSTFKKHGIKSEIGNTVKKYNSKYKYFSAPDEERAEEFMHYVQREDIQGIMCARGGWGSLRILHLLDYDIIRNNPKMIIGFSDLTALINTIYTNAGLVTFHGPVASSFNQFIYKAFKGVLLNEKKGKISISEPKAKVIVKGKAKGRIIGGNLTVLNSLLGTSYEFDTDNAILIIEEKSEDPYKIDRMLTQLKLAGKLDNIAAAIIGDVAKLDRKRNFFPGYSPTLREVFEQHFKELGKPTIISFPFGHTQRNSTIPIGAEAELDTSRKTLSFNNFNNA